MKEPQLTRIETNSQSPYYGFIDEEIESEQDHRTLYRLRAKRLDMQAIEKSRIDALNADNKKMKKTPPTFYVQSYMNVYPLDTSGPSPKIKSPRKIEKKKKEKEKEVIKERVSKVENMPDGDLKTIALEAILKKMPFDLYNECISNKRSAKYYITKPKLLEIIDTLDDLKQRMPKNYKKLPKEDICLEIYK